MKISPNGSWIGDSDLPHVFDAALADAIVAFCKNHGLKTVVDLGCGPGDYLKVFEEAGLNAIGYDGNIYTYTLTKGLGYYQELHVKIEQEYKYDLTLSLEVGEHMPTDFEQTFIDNIVSCAKNWIILSWAIPGQKGDGHVNCHTNEYIIQEMKKRGYIIDWKETNVLRNKSTSPWFKNSLMVFKSILF